MQKPDTWKVNALDEACLFGKKGVSIAPMIIIITLRSHSSSQFWFLPFLFCDAKKLPIEPELALRLVLLVFVAVVN